MQIYPTLYSYEKTPRSQVYDRKTVAVDQSEDPAFIRRDDAITGSQTVLSNSLAEALWSIQRTSGEDEVSSASSIEGLYLAYSE